MCSSLSALSNGWGYTHSLCCLFGRRACMVSAREHWLWALRWASPADAPIPPCVLSRGRLGRAPVPLLPRHSEGCSPGVRKGICQRRWRRALPFLCLHLTDSVPRLRVRKHALRFLPPRSRSPVLATKSVRNTSALVGKAYSAAG